MTSAVWLAATDLALATRRRLAADPAVRRVVGPSPLGTVTSTWVFPRELGAVVEGTGQAAVVVSIQGGWARPNAHNTAQFPRLVVQIFSDSKRDSNGIVSRPDAATRAWSVYHVLRYVLHRPSGFSEVWGEDNTANPPDPGQRVWGSQQLAEPDLESVPDWQDGVVLRTEFGLNVG